MRDNLAPARRLVPLAPRSLRPLAGVIALMSCLAALTLGGALAAWRSAQQQIARAAQAATIELPAAAGPRAPALAELRRLPGVRAARALESAEIARLLAPWLGEEPGLAQLPLPGLIALELDAQNPPDPGRLEAALARLLPGARLERHLGWRQEVRQSALALALAAALLLAAVLAVMAAAVILAVRAGCAAHRQTLDILHLVGAQDGFVARQFQLPFARMALRAAGLGTGAGMIALAAATLLLRLAPPDRTGQIAVWTLGWQPLWSDFLWLLALPAAAALIAWRWTRRETLRALRRMA